MRGVSVKYKAIIFDLDGTLLDTLEDLANSMNHVLKSQGLPIHDKEKYKYFVGNGMYNLILWEYVVFFHFT
jgi:phosphoglycolate phosphatase